MATFPHKKKKKSKTSTIIKKYSARLVSKNPRKQTYRVLVNSMWEQKYPTKKLQAEIVDHHTSNKKPHKICVCATD